MTDKNKTLTTEKENLTKANTELTEKNKTLTTEKENLTKEKTELADKNQNLTKANTELTGKNKDLDAQVGLLKGQIKSLEQSQQVLENEKAELSKENQKLTNEKTELLREKDNLTKANAELKAENQKLTTDLSNAKNQVIQANQEKDKLEQKHAPYKKLERLYEVFLEVKGCLNYGFVPQTHSAMDLIASVLSDSKYYLENLYNKASQELSDKRSDKGEKLAELFDLLFEYVKDNKFERLKEPSAYDSTCKKLYPEQNTSNKMKRVVLIGYTYDKKTTYYTIVDMGS
ncbi:hypothetical protein [Helicobacter pylori]|uniref:hypothetical protein n=1 Tax=Helicobacter pylori TaxID=210 RepID=UPI001495B3BC|nr:hypothetical protein [Helicobacter pylori]NPS34857.1 hypothetical protein [Helicobacter pylori]